MSEEKQANPMVVEAEVVPEVPIPTIGDVLDEHRKVLLGLSYTIQQQEARLSEAERQVSELLNVMDQLIQLLMSKEQEQ